MPIKFQPTSVIKARLGIESNGRIQKFFTSECAKAMDEFVPMRDGNLRDYEIDGSYIIYNQPYAHYQYEGISKSGNPLNYSKDKHPLATHHWDNVMWTAKGEDIVKKVQQKLGGK